MVAVNKPGKIKSGGRQKGVKNKRTEMLEKLGVDAVLLRKGVKPIEEILKLLPLLEPKDQVRTYLELQSYLQGKPRIVDVTPEKPAETPASEIATEELLQVVRTGTAG